MSDNKMITGPLDPVWVDLDDKAEVGYFVRDYISKRKLTLKAIPTIHDHIELYQLTHSGKAERTELTDYLDDACWVVSA